MPKVAVQYTEQARIDLQHIFERRLAQRGPDGWDGARAHLAEILATIDGIADFPERGPRLRELEPFGHTSLRQVSHPPYRIVYFLDETAATIALVADARRDFMTILQRRRLIQN
ncbi:MAG: hypothetical protein B7Y36_10240 [Novosphingobium sp. 28-62-57]|uniref:type II toxin-antitoxin system RelE/ParE family toxin n=1 Tax=unclassified Novosphingobium TaxID=2644732 RepID=UPI000BDC8C8B|nr:MULTISPECIES: type II toxin-antitoxin system RelE/ParE family toxin [unclassified Novosphingobium]OYW51299.1 MAG: hypothetical protein B7Z34_00340 [Novosphingobium sp. 12-62-10]OYZ10562.1 MAG: hypothetical protein B7Y36_10240 [Novosphingobium sp. 28-62-57]OZA40308.1 MAG: hypothetical protein B7X92_01840 [Novosphingobium sp. 17-62-9]HQS68036.1 type II toxin-antitoxin system RelE/ParE family toxin [Novosphingobium sp.]